MRLLAVERFCDLSFYQPTIKTFNIKGDSFANVHTFFFIVSGIVTVNAEPLIAKVVATTYRQVPGKHCYKGNRTQTNCQTLAVI